MTYRDDRQALRERIELLESRAAKAVSPEELAALRSELIEAKDRLEGEREALEGLLGRLDGKAQAPRRSPWKWVLLGAGVLIPLAVVAGAVVIALTIRQTSEPTYEGAPDAVRHTPVRREVDREVARLLPDLDGCLPEGHQARIQVEVIFEGRDGAIRDFTARNISQRDRYPAMTPECLEGVFSGVSAAPFRAPSYRYHVTLEWTGGRLVPPAIWESYDLL